MKSRRTPTSHRPRCAARRGFATLYLILLIPAVLALFVMLTDIANVWLARIELENGLGAAASAAVKEWGDAGGGDTRIPRIVGQAFAEGNTIVGQPLIIDLNYDPLGGGVNQNRSCFLEDDPGANLVFGAITNIPFAPPFTFNAGIPPSCAAGQVVFDVSAQGALQTGNNQEWGISYQPAIPIINPPRIVRVIYVLPVQCADGSMPRFDFSSAVPEVSFAVTDCDPNNILTDNCPGGNNVGTSSQADVFGIDRTSVMFSIDVDVDNDPCDPANGTLVVGTTPVLSRTLALDFPDDSGNDLLRFDLEEHLRFGANVTDNGGNQVGADALGTPNCETEVIVCFSDGTSDSGIFNDTNDRSNQCSQCVGVASWGSNTPLDQIPCNASTDSDGNHGLIIHPSPIPDVPCPPSSGINNNGQSLAFVGGAGLAFAVRAQASIEVKSLWNSICGLPVGPYRIRAKETAVFDCELRCPRIIRITEFICPGP